MKKILAHKDIPLSKRITELYTLISDTNIPASTPLVYDFLCSESTVTQAKNKTFHLMNYIEKTRKSLSSPDKTTLDSINFMIKGRIILLAIKKIELMINHQLLDTYPKLFPDFHKKETGLDKKPIYTIHNQQFHVFNKKEGEEAELGHGSNGRVRQSESINDNGERVTLAVKKMKIFHNQSVPRQLEKPRLEGEFDAYLQTVYETIIMHNMGQYVTGFHYEGKGKQKNNLQIHMTKMGKSVDPQLVHAYRRKQVDNFYIDLIKSLKGLTPLHDMGIIHGDFKFANICEAANGDAEAHTLIDFGGSFDQSGNGLSTLRSTFPSPSLLHLICIEQSNPNPEQSSRQDYLSKNPQKEDIFAFGMGLLFLVSKKFQTTYNQQILNLMKNVIYVSTYNDQQKNEVLSMTNEYKEYLASLQPGGSLNEICTPSKQEFSQLKSIIEKCVQIDPDKRPTIDELIAELQQFRQHASLPRQEKKRRRVREETV